MDNPGRVVFHSVKQEDAEQEFLQRRRHLTELRGVVLAAIALIFLVSALSIPMILAPWQGALLGILFLLP
jgi:hypothetical protein